MASRNWYSEEGNSEYTAEWEEHPQPQRHADYHDDERNSTSLRSSRSSQPPPRNLGPTLGYNRFSYDPTMEAGPNT
ncbi:hypothetical protein V2G26_010300 [Clonostachys chloroleuca]